MQKTTILDCTSLPVFRQPQLVVATMDTLGQIDTSHVQSLSHWHIGTRSSELVAKVYGYELLNILSNELGLIAS